MDTTADTVLSEPRSGFSGHPAFYELLDKMAYTHHRKNRDYANAADPFANFRACEKAGISMVDGIYTRMSDKWERVTNLLAKRRKGDEPAVADESLQDTLIDLANYCLIEAVALDEEGAPSGFILNSSQYNALRLENAIRDNRAVTADFAKHTDRLGG